jgi:hypothetical protein
METNRQPEPKQLTKIDPNGDLTLIVGSRDNTPRLLVCKRALARASTALQAMLFGGFREDSGDTTEVKLPEDDFDALHFILCIIQAKPWLLPPAKSFTPSKTIKLITLLDKYHLAGVVGMYHREYITKDFSTDPIPWTLLLFTAWTFAHEKNFQGYFQAIVDEDHFKDDDLDHEVPYFRSEKLTEFNTPSNCLGTSCRLKTEGEPTDYAVWHICRSDV